MAEHQTTGDTAGTRPNEDPHKTHATKTHPSHKPAKSESDRTPTLATNTAGEGVIPSDLLDNIEKARTAHTPANAGADRRAAQGEAQEKLALGSEEGTNAETTTGPAKESDDPPIRS